MSNIPEIPIVNTNTSIYAWIITILILFIGAMYLYFRSEIKTLRNELKDERDYIKSESVKNMLLLKDINNVLSNLSDKTEKSLDNTNEMKPLITTNVNRLEIIKDHVTRINNGN